MHEGQDIEKLIQCLGMKNNKNQGDISIDTYMLSKWIMGDG